MRTHMILAGVAALTMSIAFIASGADGRGRGEGQGRAQGAEKSERQGGGPGRVERGRGQEDRGKGQAGRGRGGDVERSRGERGEARVDRHGRDAGPAREVRGRGRDVDGRRLVIEDRRDWRDWAERRREARDRFVEDLTRFQSERGRRLAIGPEGCPPGLARQNIYCMPPGQLRKAQLIGQRLPLSNLAFNIPERYRYRFTDDDRFIYRYGNDGMIYRFDRGTSLVSRVIPLYSTGLFPGEPLPLGYGVYNVPLAYRGFYPDTRDDIYRYDNGAIYRVNSDSLLVESIVAMLTGGAGGLGALGVGDPLPLGYDVYNVPFAYRDRYNDTDDYLYRYADGYMYQVDPETRLIQSVISLLV